MTLTKARIQTFTTMTASDVKANVREIELKELCRLALANLETQEWLEAEQRQRCDTWPLPADDVLVKLRGGQL